MLFDFEGESLLEKRIVGVNDEEVPPVPIPNTVVKLLGAENTWPATARENRAMPTFSFFQMKNGPLVKWSRRWPLTPKTGVRLSYGSPYRAGVAQLVEQLTCNQQVVSSILPFSSKVEFYKEQYKTPCISR